MKFSPDTAGKRIRELREKKGITQKELAAARKMTQSAIAKQESGATAIGVLMLVVSFILLLLINLLQRRIETP